MSMPLPDAVLSMHTLVLGKTRAGKSSVMRLIGLGIVRNAGVGMVAVEPWVWS